MCEPHTNDCDEIYKTISDKKENIKLIENYTEYEKQCFDYLNKIEGYNKKEI